MTEQIRRQRRETERMGIVIEHTENGREQAGMSQEGRRTIEKVRENTVHDTEVASVFMQAIIPPYNLWKSGTSGTVWRQTHQMGGFFLMQLVLDVWFLGRQKHKLHSTPTSSTKRSLFG